MASRCSEALNRLYTGRLGRETRGCNASTASADMVAAWAQVHDFLFKEAALLNRERRYASMTGAKALDTLIKRGSNDRYSRDHSGNITQVPLQASAIDEPKVDTYVDLLDALDPVEADHYAHEERVVETEGKPLTLFKEIEN